MKFQVAYVPIGVGTYHLETAGEQFEQSVELLKNICKDVVCPEKILLTIEELGTYLDTVEPDLIILQNITFANGAYASEVAKLQPFSVWDGHRKENSVSLLQKEKF